MASIPRVLFFSALLGVLLVAASANPVGAATNYVVNSALDTQDISCTTSPGGCTLPDAIAAANANGGADIIHFDSSLFPPNNSGPSIDITTALPTVNATDGITIDGTGAGVRINSTSSAIDALHVQSGNGDPTQSVTIKNIQFTGTFSSGIFICGGLPAPADPACPEDVSNISVQDISFESLGANGVTVLGNSGSDVTVLDSSFASVFNQPIGIQLTGSSSNIEIARNR